MRLGLIADIHSNLVALEAVLDDMPVVDQIVCAGDIVGYNPWPSECVERIREVASVCVQGNHDRAVETPEKYAHNRMAQAGLELASEQLNEEQREWLVTLPKRTTIADDRFRLVHSHPDSEKLGAYVFPENFPRMRPYLDTYDGVVLGHTHIQDKATIDDRIIVNPGSVGQPRDGNSNAAYAVLDTDESRVELHRVSYDINQVISRVEDIGLPIETGTRLLDGS